MRRDGLFVISIGHLSVDLNQGALPALLPFVVAQHGLSYVQGSLLVLAATISSSVAQPLFGHLSDRRAGTFLLPLGTLVGGLGMAVSGLAPGFLLLLGAVLVSGIGVAAYHPEAARQANWLSGTRQGTGMSLFQLGGNVGWALGPLVTAGAVLALGLPGTLLLAVPALAATALLWHERDRVEVGRRELVAAPWQPVELDRWRPFAWLNVAIAFRSFVHFGLLTFVPLFYVVELGASAGSGSLVLALILGGGAAGNLAGGVLADRFGNRRVLIVSLAALTPLLAGFIADPGGLLGTVCLGLAGACAVSTFGVVVVMGQEYLPSRIGVAAGFTIGLSIGLGGVAAPALGAVADAHGLWVTMTLIALLPLGGVAAAVALPGGSTARWRQSALPDHPHTG